MRAFPHLSAVRSELLNVPDASFLISPRNEGKVQPFSSAGVVSPVKEEMGKQSWNPRERHGEHKDEGADGGC